MPTTWLETLDRCLDLSWAMIVVLSALTVDGIINMIKAGFYFLAGCLALLPIYIFIQFMNWWVS